MSKETDDKILDISIYSISTLGVIEVSMNDFNSPLNVEFGSILTVGLVPTVYATWPPSYADPPTGVNADKTPLEDLKKYPALLSSGFPLT